ncbi:MAG: chloride channel protein [Pseudomonadales bacterium]|nr:chloride channel protein [Pseudomonadales bacterium]
MAIRKLPSDYSIRGFRRRLANFDSVPQFALLGIVSGLVTGLVILAFRILVELPLSLILADDFENFESLSHFHLLMMPIAGGVALAVILNLVKPETRRVGVVHVLERLARFQGHLPWRNALLQFVGGVIALGTGHSGGREGPAIHLGAACSSLVGQALSLPNNSIRILVGCGAAAAISASFNTPMAGVIFSMEVIIMEYTIAGFIPVILAAVIATLVNQPVYGSLTAFDVPPSVHMKSFWDLPFLLIEGAVIGVIAAVFVRAIKVIFQYTPSTTWLRMLIAGVVTGLVALAMPQILGQGYDTVNQALAGELALTLILAVCVFKLIASATTVALGVPVGVIGPTLFIGATAGGVIGYVGAHLFPETASTPAFYVMLGMGAMMGAALQAPLAALMAVMELTHNPNIILPAMLVIIVANMTASQIFGVRSVFITQMEILGLEFRQNPLSMALNRASVASIMTRSFDRTKRVITRERAAELLTDRPAWLLVDGEKGPSFILRAEDLTAHLEKSEAEEIDLQEIPATRKDVTSVLLQATLAEAFEALRTKGVQAVYVNRISAPMIDSVVGIVTKEDIESYYQS